MTVEIRSAKVARAAFSQVEERSTLPSGGREKYLSFARSFPTLIHTSGLAQAAACALAKGEAKGAEKLQVLDDLSQVMNAAGDGWNFENGRALDAKARSVATDVHTYLRLTRQALQSATWIKRYAEALLASSGTANAGEMETPARAAQESEGP